MTKKQMIATYVWLGFVLMALIAKDVFGVSSININWCFPVGIIVVILIYIFKKKSKPGDNKKIKALEKKGGEE